MNVHKLVSCGLAASAVLLVAGAAFSGGAATTTNNQLTAFEPSTGRLSGIRVGTSNTVSYQHDANTVHLAAIIIPRETPPDPCDVFGVAWNAVVKFDERNHTNSTSVFETLLTGMATSRCYASVTSLQGSPEPIVAITPQQAP